MSVHHSTTTPTTSPAITMIYDTLILGAGPAGLSAALGLARQLYSVVVFDSQNYRNYPTSHMHNVLTWDHKSPAEFRESARANILTRYDGIVFRESRIDSIVNREDGSFEVTDELGDKTIGRKVVLATGVRDVMPDIDGFVELWGGSMSVLSHNGYHEVENRFSNARIDSIASSATATRRLAASPRASSPLEQSLTLKECCTWLVWWRLWPKIS
jgi:thioredoxin reductase